jgi:hypothetical protein
MDAVLFLYGAVAFTPYSTELSLEAQIKAFSAELRAEAAAGAPDHLVARLLNKICVLFIISMLNSFAKLVVLAEQGKLAPGTASPPQAPVRAARKDAGGGPWASAHDIAADCLTSWWAAATAGASPSGSGSASEPEAEPDAADTLSAAAEAAAPTSLLPWPSCLTGEPSGPAARSATPVWFPVLVVTRPEVAAPSRLRRASLTELYPRIALGGVILRMS